MVTQEDIGTTNSIKIRIFNIRGVKVFQIPRSAQQGFQSFDDKKNEEVHVLNCFILQLIFLTEVFFMHVNKNRREDSDYEN